MGRMLIGLLVILLAGCSDDTVLKGLKRSEAEYVAQFGAAARSPMTPDQALFNPAPGTRVLVRFAEGRSIEELWMIEGTGEGVPPAVWKRAQQLAGPMATPMRTVVFKERGHAAADLFEQRVGSGKITVERRAGRLVRIGLCTDAGTCHLLASTIQGEIVTDDWMDRAEKVIQREQRH